MSRLSWRGRRKRDRDTQLAGALVDRVLSSYDLTRDVRAHRLIVQWGDVVGERVAARTWPDGLRDGVLWVRVANSAWLQELSFLRPAIIDRANQLLEATMVRELRLHIGARRRQDIDDADQLAALARAVQRPAQRTRPRGDTQPATIDAECAAVADPELREAIREARTKLGL